MQRQKLDWKTWCEVHVALKPRSSSFRLFIGAWLAALTIAACTTVPETGRRQVMLVPAGQETSLGMTEFQKLKQSTPVSKDATSRAMVERVGKRIAKVAPLPNAEWEFVLFDEPKTANAFCLPGGKVGVYTGLLPVTQTEAGLATVIGHEVAHAVARHGGERMSEAMVVQLGGMLLDEALKTRTEQVRAITQQAYGVAGNVGVILPHSRKQELEADNLGMTYMARAGYDPRESIEFWKRFADYNAKRGNTAPFAFLSTHPVDETRIKQLQELLPKAMAEYRKKK